MKEVNQALALIKQVVEAYRGNLQEHSALQQAMQLITKELNGKIEIKETKVETKKT